MFMQAIWIRQRQLHRQRYNGTIWVRVGLPNDRCFRSEEDDLTLSFTRKRHLSSWRMIRIGSDTTGAVPVHSSTAACRCTCGRHETGGKAVTARRKIVLSKHTPA